MATLRIPFKPKIIYKLQDAFKRLMGCIMLLLFPQTHLHAQEAHPCNAPLEHEDGEVTFYPTQTHALQGDIVFREGAHAVIRIDAAYGVDGPVETTFELILKDVSGFPIPFTLKLDEEVVFPIGGYFTISADVNLGPGSNYYIGDFMTKLFIPISQTDINPIIIPVTRLERCGSEGSGGVC